MPTITINGRPLDFEQGQSILDVALANEIEVPHYCYHPGLSAPANCRICLAEVWAPNPRNDNRLESYGKLVPTCRTDAADGQVVYTDSPKAIQNQKAVMEYLLINHPVDCPVCDQAGECHLQDYSYQYGRSQARFTEQKIKQPKKDIGPHVLLYSDRCIMCTRCVRFTREVTGTGELIVEGRGAMEQIDVFPGKALDNELSGNVIDICPVGALLDKEFLFQQRVWFLEKTPSIDGLTCSGDNISVEHNKGMVYRIKPRANLEVNRYWITDELRYGWSFIHDDSRLNVPALKGVEPFEPARAREAYDRAYDAALDGLTRARRLALLVSPMLSCEDAYWLARLALDIDPDAKLFVGPIPYRDEDKTFLDGFTMYAEKVPNARGVRRVLEAMASDAVGDADAFARIASSSEVDAALITGNYPSDWITDDLVDALRETYTVVIDTLPNRLTERANALLPGATWVEKAGTFENVNNRLQAFERAINPIDYCKNEAQIAIDLLGLHHGDAPRIYNPNETRECLSRDHGLSMFVSDVEQPAATAIVESDMDLVEL